MTRVVFRADAGPRIGAGHVARCLALAGALAGRGASIAFAMRRGSARAVSGFDTSGFERIDLPEEDDDVPPLLAALGGGTDVLIVDHYGWHGEQERATRPRARRIVVIDDLADRAHDADLLIDATPGRGSSAYRSKVPQAAKLLLGPQFAMLRPEFAALRPKVAARRTSNDEVLSVLVSFGGLDSKNLTQRSLDAIVSSGIDSRFVVVLGGAAPHVGSIGDSVKRIAARGFDVTLHLQSERMGELMMKADLAIGAAGGTALERCVLGLPSIVVALADNQLGAARALAAEGAIEFLGSHENVSSDEIGKALTGLATDVDKRRGMSERAAEICDGLGACRVANAVTALAA